MLRVGVDVGGTFTDLVLYAEGTLSKTKVLSTPHAPEQGVFSALTEANVREKDVSYFIHGTTLVTNLIVARTGAKVGLITTKGFRDVLEIGRSYRRDPYNLQEDKPKPFVPRYLVFEVTERVDHEGGVLVPLERPEVESALRKLLSYGVEAIAVSLFNSYANRHHERIIRDLITDLAPDLYYTLSSEVDPRVREYQRTSTAVLNAYALPKTHGYIEKLDDSIGVSVKYMHSGGGVLPSAEAQKFPIKLVASGPAAGVLAGKAMGERAGFRNIVTADVGGTSFDVCVIRDGQPDMKDVVEVQWGIPVRTQSIDVISIGAGGGSIGWVDDGGALRVGPQSAGAQPGPACYGLGGLEPTITDANLILGLVNPGNFLGGKLKLDDQKSRTALKGIADYFDISIEAAAAGMYRIANANMTQAILEVTVRKGIDPRDFALIAFGGAGGQHAVEVAKDVGIPVVVFPRNASIFSAFGLLTADLQNTVSRTVLTPPERLSRLKPLFKELEVEARQFLAGEEPLITGVQVEYRLDARYVGQSTELAVSLGSEDAIGERAFYREFERLHHAMYGTQLGDPIEIVNAAVTVTGYLPNIEFQGLNAKSTSKKIVPTFRRRVALVGKEIPVIERHKLQYGMTISGACIVEDLDSAFFISDGCSARVDSFENIVVNLRNDAPGQQKATNGG